MHFDVGLLMDLDICCLNTDAICVDFNLQLLLIVF